MAGMHAPANAYELAAPLREVTVAEAMTTGVINCAPDTPLRTVATLMATYRVHAIFVFLFAECADDELELWGVVSDLDLVAAARHGLECRTAGQSAVTPLVTVLGTDTLERAAELMALNGVSHLAVLDPATPRPVGVISTLDIARELASPGQTRPGRTIYTRPAGLR
jgi:CBS domain-containing protein